MNNNDNVKTENKGILDANIVPSSVSSLREENEDHFYKPRTLKFHPDAILKVATTNNSKSKDIRLLSGSIVAVIKEHGYCVLKSLGDAALGRSLRGVERARRHLISQGFDAWCIPFVFLADTDKGEERPGYAILIEQR